jgi:hypothetical protein
MDFNTIKRDVLYEDGSLRDILVRGTSRQIYKDLHSLLAREGIRQELSIDDKPATIEQAIAEFDKGSERFVTIIRFYVGHICFVCHFFEEQEIEIDFVPNEIRTQSDWDAIRKILGILSVAFRQPVGVYAESDHDIKLYEIGAQQSVAPLPRDPRTGHSEGAR